MKKFLAILIALFIIVSAAACKSKDSSTETSPTAGTSTDTSTDGGSDTQTPAKDTLNIALTQDRGTLDPMYVLGYDIMAATRMMYEPMWEYDASGTRNFILATGMELVEPTVWRITLREGITFSNGSAFTAEDVLFSLDRGNNRTGEPPYFGELDLTKSKAVDDYTVELVFTKYDLSYEYSMGLIYMFDKETCNGDLQAPSLATTPVGTGPYALKDYVINSHMDLTLRDDYWGDKPTIKNLHFAIMSEDSQRVTGLQTGTIDIGAIPYQDIEFAKGLESMNVYVGSASQGASLALYFNLHENSAFHDNEDARKAVAYAIDREAIRDVTYSGFGTVSRLPISQYDVDVEDRFLDVGVYGVGLNLDLAKELAESSGLSGQTIKIITNGSSDRQTTSELIQADLLKINVKVEINNLDPGSWLAVAFDETQDFDMALDMTAAPSMTLAQNYSAWIGYGLGGTFTRNAWNGDTRCFEMNDVIMSTTDPAARSEMYMEYTEFLTNAVLWYNLVDLEQAFAYHKDLKGFSIQMSGGIIYSDLSW